MPDLMEVIHLWIAEKKTSIDKAQQSNITQEIPPKLAWLQDVNKAAQYLTRLSLEVDAQVALIIRDARIWAYAGQLSKSATEELAQFVGHHWANGNGSDLARFVRLETTGSEYMLYTTHIGSGFVLALSFKTEMPFSKMRSQTGELARKLTSPLPESPAKLERTHEQDEMAHTLDGINLGESQWVLESDDEPDSFKDNDRNADDARIERQQAMFEELLTTLDFPDPDGSSSSQKVRTKTSDIPSMDDPSVEVAPNQQKSILHPETRVEPPLILESAPFQDADPLTQTDVQLESSSFAQHDLAYSCVLLPRLPDHHLTGVLTGLLTVEMSRLCLAFGWRLEHLGIRPEYLHWVVGVTPDESASMVIHNIREQTSSLLFNEFPRLVNENPSGDFWAPGFMVVHGRRPLAGSLVQDFIRQTRARQGIDHIINSEKNA